MEMYCFQARSQRLACQLISTVFRLQCMGRRDGLLLNTGYPTALDTVVILFRMQGIILLRKSSYFAASEAAF
jgi:hypothetical protein